METVQLLNIRATESACQTEHTSQQICVYVNVLLLRLAYFLTIKIQLTTAGAIAETSLAENDNEVKVLHKTGTGSPYNV